MGRLISEKYAAWQAECEERFQQLKKNEEELNRIFIDIYGLQDELTPDVADKDITVHRVFDSKDDVPEAMKGSNYVRTMRDEIVSLISYAVGCMFGRYSLDVDGLAYTVYWYDSEGRIQAAGHCFKGKRYEEYMLISFSYYDYSVSNSFGHNSTSDNSSDNGGSSIRDDYDNPEDLWEENQDWYEDEDEAWDEWYDG